MTVLESGSGKSGSMEAAMGPIYGHEQKLVDRANVPDGGTNEVGLVSSDPTPEALEKRLRANDGRFAVKNAEAGDLFSILEGKYSSNGSGANIGLFLKGYSGENHRSDRVLRGSTYIHEPRLTLVLALQPRAFERVCASQEFRERGFFARFLLDCPDSLLGYRKSEPTPIPKSLKEGWYCLLSYLIQVEPPRDEHDRPRPFVIPVDHKANKVLRDFQEWSEVGLRPGYWESCREFGARAREHVIKIAGLLHILAECATGAPWESPITEATISAAIKVFQYHAEHVRIAAGSASERRKDARLEYLIERIKSKPEWKEAFNVRTLWQLVKSRRGIHRMEDLLRDLHRLEEYGWIQQGAERKGRSISYLVSPYVHSGNHPQYPQTQAKPFAIELKSRGVEHPQQPPLTPNTYQGGKTREVSGGIGGAWGQTPPPEFSHTPSASHDNGGVGGNFPHTTLPSSSTFRRCFRWVR